jgi:DNA-nicking Smr family endonuclease
VLCKCAEIVGGVKGIGGLIGGFYYQIHGKTEPMAKIVLDLHEIFNKGQKIEAELNRVMEEATDKKISLLEIIPGKGSGQLKKRVLRFLAQPEVKKLYHRLENDDKNFGRIFVHFRF